MATAKKKKPPTKKANADEKREARAAKQAADFEKIRLPILKLLGIV